MIKATTPNRAYLASCLWHFVQIQPNGRNSDTLGPLCTIELRFKNSPPPSLQKIDSRLNLSRAKDFIVSNKLD